MKSAQYFLIILLLFTNFILIAQVKTNFNNDISISTKGYFSKNYKQQIDFEVPSKNINELLDLEKKVQANNPNTKFNQIAVAVPIDLDIAKLTNWSDDGEMAFGKFTIKLNGALTRPEKSLHIFIDSPLTGLQI